jgi:uncharacterized membrane protein
MSTNSATISGIIECIEEPAKTVVFSVAHSHAWIGPDGEPRTGTTTVKCRAFGHGMNRVMKYGEVGISVVVAGRVARIGGEIGIICDTVVFPHVDGGD